jgi:predicted acyl esterase
MDQNSDNSAVLNDKIDLPTDTPVELSKVITNPMSIVGNINLSLNLTIDTPQTDVVAEVRKVDSSGKVKSLGLWAKKVFWSVATIHVDLELGPVLESFSSGDQLQVILTGNIFTEAVRNTNSPVASYFDRFNPAHVTLVSSPSLLSSISYTVQPDAINVRPKHLSKKRKSIGVGVLNF